MLNPLLFGENNHHNPAKLLSEIHKDLKDLEVIVNLFVIYL